MTALSRPRNSEANRTKITEFSKTVAATGTPERLFATRGQHLVDTIIVVALRTNTMPVYVGRSPTDDSQHVPLPAVFSALEGKKLDPYDYYADATVNGEGVRVVLMS